MSAQTHETERLLRRIRELEIEYEAQERLKENTHMELVKKLEAAQMRIQELESQVLASKRPDNSSVEKTDQ